MSGGQVDDQPAGLIAGYRRSEISHAGQGQDHRPREESRYAGRSRKSLMAMAGGAERAALWREGGPIGRDTVMLVRPKLCSVRKFSHS